MRRILKRFWHKDDGGVTVEFVLWMPLIAGVILGAFELNALVLTQSNMWNVARDTARRVSTGEYTTVEAEAYADTQLTFLGYTYDITVTSGTDVTVLITTSLSNVAVIGMIGTTNNYNITASVTMRVES